MRSLWKITFLMVTQEFGICKSQERPFYTFPKYSNHSVGQDFCQVHRLVESGQIERRDALRGMELRPVLMKYQINAETGAIDEANPDIAVMFLDELALRAGFRWRNSYGVVATPTNDTWTEAQYWGSGAYDLVGEFFVKTEEKMGLGLLFPEWWADASIIMVQKTEEVEKDFFKFLQPFTYILWVVIGLILFVSGFVYYLLDYLNSRAYATEMDLDLRDSLFNAAWMFTGHSLHNPRSTATRFLVCTLSLLCLITVAAYTANLAYFLVKEKTGKINSITDVIKYNLRCCIDQNTVLHEIIAKNYPFLQLVPKEDPLWGHEIFHSLARSECSILITDVSTFEVRKRSAEFNPYCNLERVGKKIHVLEGSFSIMDSENLCTSLLKEVLSLHMLEMKRDKTFDNIWNKFLSRTATAFCTDTKEEIEDHEKISIANVSGMFIIYFAVVLFAILWSLFRFYHKKRQNELDSSRTESQPFTQAARNGSSEALTQDLNLRVTGPSSMCTNFGQEVLSSERPRIELEAVESFPSPLKSCKENMSLHVCKCLEKLVEIETKKKNELRQMIESDKRDLCELLESQKNDLHALVERDRQERLKREEKTRKKITYLEKKMVTNVNHSKHRRDSKPAAQKAFR